MGNLMNEKVKIGVALLIFGALAISVVFALQSLDIEEEEQQGIDGGPEQVSNVDLIARAGGFCGAIFLIAGIVVIFIYSYYPENS